MAKAAKGIIGIGDIVFNSIELNTLKVLFRVISHPPKLKILKRISEAGEGGICVQDIYKDRSIRLGQSHASIMLSELRKQHLVNTRRDGKNIFYTVNKDQLKTIQEICSLVKKLHPNQQQRVELSGPAAVAVPITRFP